MNEKNALGTTPFSLIPQDRKISEHLYVKSYYLRMYLLFLECNKNLPTFIRFIHKKPWISNRWNPPFSILKELSYHGIGLMDRWAEFLANGYLN